MIVRYVRKRIKQRKEKEALEKFNREHKTLISPNVVFDKTSRIGEHVKLIAGSYKKAEIGDYTYIGAGNFDMCRVGRFCSISVGIVIIESEHPISFVSTSPMFFNTKNKDLYNFNTDLVFEESPLRENGYRVEIGNDVWIGRDVRIRHGVKIGDGAIIGACALVTKDVPPYAIVGGVPARIIRYRFEQETIDKLLQVEWWNWPIEKISEYSRYFDSPNNLFEHLKPEKNRGSERING